MCSDSYRRARSLIDVSPSSPTEQDWSSSAAVKSDPYLRRTLRADLMELQRAQQGLFENTDDEPQATLKRAPLPCGLSESHRDASPPCARGCEYAYPEHGPTSIGL